MDWRDFLRTTPNAAIWFNYHNAPEELRALSSCGGDEDQIVVHLASSKSYFHKFDDLSCCSNDRIEFEDFIVWIGCHA